LKRAARAAVPSALLGIARYAPAAARSQPCSPARGGARINSSLPATVSSTRPWAARRRGVSAGA